MADKPRMNNRTWQFIFRWTLCIYVCIENCTKMIFFVIAFYQNNERFVFSFMILMYDVDTKLCNVYNFCNKVSLFAAFVYSIINIICDYWSMWRKNVCHITYYNLSSKFLRKHEIFPQKIKIWNTYWCGKMKRSIFYKIIPFLSNPKEKCHFRPIAKFLSTQKWFTSIITHSALTSWSRTCFILSSAISKN